MDSILVHIYYKEKEHQQLIEESIAAVPRLNELVRITHESAFTYLSSAALLIEENKIQIQPDFTDARPPVIFPTALNLTTENLLGCIFVLLHNFSEAKKYLAHHASYLLHIDLYEGLIEKENQEEIFSRYVDHTDFEHAFENFAFNHNVAMLLQYGFSPEDISPEAIIAHYNDALKLAFEPLYKGFTLKHYLVYLTSLNEQEQTKKLLSLHPIENHFPPICRYGLEKIRIEFVIVTDYESYIDEEKRKLKLLLWEVLQFFEKHEIFDLTYSLYRTAAIIAQLEQNYAESLGYLSKAITYYQQEEMTFMAAHALMQKGTLLLAWAQTGNPQFYQTAITTFQEAAKFFTKENAPDSFAHIHHMLGIIYAELPDENKKRAIWAALSAASFNEALEFFTHKDYPNQYATICFNFGNAYNKFPSSKRTDNFVKACELYTAALTVRTAQNDPVELMLILMAYLDASWLAGNKDELSDVARFNDMMSKAQELLALATDENVTVIAQNHIQQLEKIKLDI